MRLAWLAAVAALGAIVSHERPASACGGCFHGVAPTEKTVVTGHRMAFAVTPAQTVLWDQIQYSGDPREFAWVLPVHPGTTLELSYDEWFAALDASTQPQITGPTPSGPSGGGGGCGCGSSTASLNAAGGAGGGEVQVITQKVVGPYETVTLRATDPQALETWLSQHGFDLPAAIKPTVDAYTSEGFDFIALRLQPGQGVQAMKPVRVITPGTDLSLPLRMVAAGVGANVGITLWVIGEGRYEAQSFPNAELVDVGGDAALVWNTSTNRSNYEDLAASAMAKADGRTWLTEAAQPASLARSGGRSTGNVYLGTPGLADAYFGACGGMPPCDATPDAGDDASGDDGGDAASAPDAADASTQSCPTMNGPTDCPWFDDLALATSGLHATDVWVTRMRALLPAAALTAGDLRLQASAAQTTVSNQHYASRSSATGASIAARPVDSTASSALLTAIGVFITAAVIRRKKK